MSSPIEWTFKMADQVSGPALSASRGVGELVRSFDSALNILDRVAGAAVGAGRAMAAALEPAMFKESTIAGLSVLLKDSQKAEEMYREAVRFAAATPFETRQIVESYQKLLVAGFKETEIPVVLKAVGDLAAIKGFSQETIDRVTMAFGQIQAKGKMQGEEILQLAEAGVPLGRVYETLAQIYGKNTDEIRKMQEAGKIGADAGIFAVLKVLRDDIGGGKLGAVMDKTSRTLSGMVSTLRSRPFEYLQELEDTGGFDALKDSISALNAALDPASEKGQKLLAVVKDFGGGLLERLFGPLDEAGVDAIMDTLIGGMERLEGATFGFIDGLTLGLGSLGEMGDDTASIEELSAAFKTLGTDLGVIVQVGAKVARTIAWIYDTAHDLGKWLSSNETLSSLLGGGLVFNPLAAAATGSLGQGFAQSTVGGWFGANTGGPLGARGYANQEAFSASYNALTETGGRTEAYYMVEALRSRAGTTGEYAGDGLVAGIDEGLRSSLEVRSPSRVTEGIGQEIGGYAGEGLAKGLRGGVASGAAGLSFAPTINVTASTVADAEGIAKVVEDVLAAQVEAWALQLGVA